MVGTRSPRKRSARAVPQWRGRRQAPRRGARCRRRATRPARARRRAPRASGRAGGRSATHDVARRQERRSPGRHARPVAPRRQRSDSSTSQVDGPRRRGAGEPLHGASGLGDLDVGSGSVTRRRLSRRTPPAGRPRSGPARIRGEARSSSTTNRSCEPRAFLSTFIAACRSSKDAASYVVGSPTRRQRGAVPLDERRVEASRPGRPARRRRRSRSRRPRRGGRCSRWCARWRARGCGRS